MPRYFTVFLSFVFFLSPVFCRGQEKVSPFLFEETSYDFGTAKEDGGELVHVYRFTNVSRDTVIITQIRTLCRCTRGEASPRVVLPGAGGSIKVTFSPYGYTGEQYKGVTVVTDRKSEDKLTFSVSIIPRRKSVEEKYPVTVGPGLRIEKTDFNFQNMPEGSSVSIPLRFVNVSGQELHLSAEMVSSDGIFSVSCPEATAPGAEGEIMMTCTAAGHAAGFHSGSFALSAYGCPGEVSVSLSAVVTDDFSSLSGSSPRPSMRIGGTYVNIGTVNHSAGLRRVSYTLKNEGTAPLTIRDIYCPEGFSVTMEKGASVSPGASRCFDVIVDVPQFPEGALFGTVKILSDDPSCPVKDLMIAARIVK